jgi:DNA-binding FadR family transcriptional regulator
MDKSMLSKVKSVRVFEQAVEQLRKAILGGDYGTGQRLPTEQELRATGLAVTIRALRVLEAEGLIAVRRGSGAYVVMDANSRATRGSVIQWLAQREETVFQILDVRERIEGLTAALTAKCSNLATLEALRRIVDSQTAVSKGEDAAEKVDQLADLDIDFHLALGAASGNDIANEIVSHIVPAFSRANRAVLWIGSRIKESVVEHQGILRAVEAGDSIEAERLMRAHVRGVHQDLEHIESRRPPDVEPGNRMLR